MSRSFVTVLEHFHGRQKGHAQQGNRLGRSVNLIRWEGKTEGSTNQPSQCNYASLWTLFDLVEYWLRHQVLLSVEATCSALNRTPQSYFAWIRKTTWCLCDARSFCFFLLRTAGSSKQLYNGTVQWNLSQTWAKNNEPKILAPCRKKRKAVQVCRLSYHWPGRGPGLMRPSRPWSNPRPHAHQPNTTASDSLQQVEACISASAIETHKLLSLPANGLIRWLISSEASKPAELHEISSDASTRP